MTAGAVRALWARPDRRWLFGLVGVALVAGGSSWFHMAASPPYRSIDEQAHVGYVLALTDGTLPTVDTAIDAEAGGDVLVHRLDREPAPRRDVWVANNPPFPYLVAAPPALLGRALGIPGGPLTGMRAMSVASTALAAVVLARLARRLAGGDPTVGLLAAALFAATPHVGFIGGMGLTDGLALLVSLLLLDALAELCERGPTRRQIVALGLWCAAGAAIRPMTAVLAAAVAAGALAVTAWRRRDRVTVAKAAATLGGPAIAISAAWYAANIARYGDPTGSQRLLEKFGRVPRGSAAGFFSDASVTSELARTLLLRQVPAQLPGDVFVSWTVLRPAVAVAATAVVVRLIADQLVARHRRAPARTPGLAWLAMAGATAVVLAMIAVHWSGGGSPHARYLFPVWAIACAGVTVTVVRHGTRWAGVALVGAMAWSCARQFGFTRRFFEDRPPQPFDGELAAALLPRWVQALGLAAAVVGLLAVLAAVIAERSGPAGPSALEDPEKPQADGASSGIGMH